MLFRLPKLLLLLLLLSAVFTGCNQDETTASVEDMSYQDRQILDVALKSSSVNRLSYKLNSLDIVDSLSIKLPFKIIEPISINFYDENGMPINSNNISFTEENWSDYSSVTFDENVSVNNIYYQIIDQSNRFALIKLIDDVNHKEAKSIKDENILTETQYNEFLSQGYIPEEISEILFSASETIINYESNSIFILKENDCWGNAKSCMGTHYQTIFRFKSKGLNYWSKIRIDSM